MWKCTLIMVNIIAFFISLLPFSVTVLEKRTTLFGYFFLPFCKLLWVRLNCNEYSIVLKRGVFFRFLLLEQLLYIAQVVFLLSSGLIMLKTNVNVIHTNTPSGKWNSLYTMCCLLLDFKLLLKGDCN